MPQPVTLKLQLKAPTKEALNEASFLLDKSLTLKSVFTQVRKRDYTQKDGLYGQTRTYKILT